MSLPKPFARPSVSVTQQPASDGVRRTWQDVSTSSIEVGDMVAERGLVTAVSPSDGTVTFSSGASLSSLAVPTVYAFTRFI